MTITPDEQRLILLLVSAFASKLPEPEKSESWELVARIQQHRSEDADNNLKDEK